MGFLGAPRVPFQRPEVVGFSEILGSQTLRAMGIKADAMGCGVFVAWHRWAWLYLVSSFRCLMLRGRKSLFFGQELSNMIFPCLFSAIDPKFEGFESLRRVGWIFGRFRIFGHFGGCTPTELHSQLPKVTTCLKVKNGNQSGVSSWVAELPHRRWSH